MYNRVSETARYGGLTRGPAVIDKSTKIKMQKVLNEIQSGKFASEWIEIYENEKNDSFEKLMHKLENHQIEKVGKDLRERMFSKE